jgi:prepilin-type N-terminal cleavage/methylation domain-containing protein/prepilin-type processing-associated H-X9-DG protein
MQEEKFARPRRTRITGSPSFRAFTLVELLVVIGIIGLLVAILLPSLNKARRAGNSVACLANLRSIGQALTIYVSENNGYLPGSGNTTGRGLYVINAAGNCNAAPGVNIRSLNGNTVIQTEDWIGPLATVMGLPIPHTDDGRQRFLAYVNMPQFQCPEYTTALMTPFTGAGDQTLGVQPALSYCEALGFMITTFRGGSGTTTHLPGNVTGPGSPYFTIPNSYFPRITKVGKTSQKVFVADGNRSTFTYGANPEIPTYTLSSDPADTNQNGNMFADFGVAFGDSHAWDLTADPVNISVTGHKPGFDCRALSFRHGSAQPFGPQGAYMLNVVFFDGHAETLADTDASNPNLWLPAGAFILPSALTSTLQTSTGEPLVYWSAQKHFGLFGMPGNWVAQ